jgi:hypothetical protein
MSDSNDSVIPDSLAGEDPQHLVHLAFHAPPGYGDFRHAQAAIVQIAERFRHNLAEAGDQMPIEGREALETALFLHLLLMRDGTPTTVDYRTAPEYKDVRTWLTAVARTLRASVESRDVSAGKQAVARAASSKQPDEILQQAAAQNPVQVWSAILADPHTARFVAERAYRPQFPPVPEQLATRLPEQLDVRDLSAFIVDFGDTQRSLEP